MLMMIRYILFLLLLIVNYKVWADNDPILHFNFNEASGTPYVTELVKNTQFPLSHIFLSPERIQAVSGTALKMDGYSTYGQYTYQIDEVSRQMTIEAWYATEAFSPSTNANRTIIEGAALISQMTSNAGFALKIGSYGNISLDFYADGKKYEVTTAGSISKYVWNHIVATINLDAQEAQIFVNGILWQKASLDMHNALSFADAPMYIGRHSSTELIEGFNITTLNGAIDDLQVFDVSMSDAEVINRYKALAPEIAPEITFADFETENYGNWTVIGNAFGAGPSGGSLEGQLPVEGYRGSKLVNSFHGGDGTQGKLTSPGFTIGHGLIKLLVGGGNHPGKAEVRLLVNGTTVRTATGTNSETLTESVWDVGEFIGETAKIEIVDSVTGGWGHILIDHIVFTEEQELLPADLFFDPAVRHAGDHLRPQYHAMPVTSWTNEPYGLTYYNGKYHLFFQKNPNGLWLHFMHWGHLSSPDLVHWQEEKIALAPSPGFDDFGIWSGTTIKDHNGVPMIFYTGVDLGRAGIGVAFPKDEDLVEWEKYSNNPIIPQAPGGFLDFRDPYVWEDNGTYYMIVGTGLPNEGGGVLPTYKSTDLINWSRITNLYGSKEVSESGFFWEMPLFYPLNDQGEYILAVTPLYPGKPANVIYWIGKWEGEKFTPYDETPKLLEPVRDNMLAPAIGMDEEGRIVYIGIVPENRNVADQLAAGWRQTFSLPRVIRLLEDFSIGQYPHPNLCRLRQNEITIIDRKITENSGDNFPEFSGNQVNLSFNVKADSASKFTLQLLKNEEGNQNTSFTFDLSSNKITLDTRFAHSQAAEKEFKTFDYVFDYKEEIDIEVFIDHSIVEVFVDNLLVISARVYPSETSLGVDLITNQGEVNVVKAQQWTMQNMANVSSAAICEPSFLPTEFRKKPEEPIINGLKKNDDTKAVNIYPNPAKESIHVELLDYIGPYEVLITAMDGAVIRRIENQTAREINISGIAKGIYIVQVKGKSFSEYLKILIQ